MTAQNQIEFDRKRQTFLLKGDLTFDTVPQFLQQSGMVLDYEGPVQIDLQGIQRSDSAGLALLIYWIRDTRQHNRAMMFYNMPQQMIMIAKASGLDPLLPVQDS